MLFNYNNKYILLFKIYIKMSIFFTDLIWYRCFHIHESSFNDFLNRNKYINCLFQKRKCGPWALHGVTFLMISWSVGKHRSNRFKHCLLYKNIYKIDFFFYLRWNVFVFTSSRCSNGPKKSSFINNFFKLYYNNFFHI